MNITLIGMAGAGKSIIGKRLATRLGYQFIDPDEIIEKKMNLGLQQIIDQFGEGCFLEIEEQAVLDLGPVDHLVISPGGSVVYSEKAMRFLKESSAVIFLDAPFESIQRHIPDQSRRGIIGLKKKDLKTLFRERQSLYQKYSDITIQLSEYPNMDAVLEEILQKFFALSQPEH